MRFFSIAIASIAILQITINFPIGRLFSLYLDDDPSRYFSALLYFVACLAIYAVFSMLLLQRRIKSSGIEFNLPHRGELLIHVGSLIVASVTLTGAIALHADSVKVGSLRVFEFFSYLGSGVTAITWISFYKVTVHGPEDAQRDLDIQLRSRTFMKAPDWLEGKNHDNS